MGHLDKPKSIYAGCPAKFIRGIAEPDEATKIKMFSDIIQRYMELTKYYDISTDYPLIKLSRAMINVETCQIYGKEDDVTDTLRDYLRRYGIKIYTSRGFKSL